MLYISTFSFGICMAASTLCIRSVVSRHIMYLIKYYSNNKISFDYVKQTITIPLLFAFLNAIINIFED